MLKRFYLNGNSKGFRHYKVTKLEVQNTISPKFALRATSAQCLVDLPVVGILDWMKKLSIVVVYHLHGQNGRSTI